MCPTTVLFSFCKFDYIRLSTIISEEWVTRFKWWNVNRGATNYFTASFMQLCMMSYQAYEGWAEMYYKSYVEKDHISGRSKTVTVRRKPAWQGGASTGNQQTNFQISVPVVKNNYFLKKTFMYYIWKSELQREREKERNRYSIYWFILQVTTMVMVELGGS